MSYPTVKYISLDVYNNNIVCINAKQYDTVSRSVVVTCTEYGKKYVIDSTEVKAYIGYSKPDVTYVIEEVTVNNDGTITIPFSEQMLSYAGRCKADVWLVDRTSEMTTDSNGNVSFLDSSVLSTMCFYVNVLPSAVNPNSITSSNEFKAFVEDFRKLQSIVEKLKTLHPDVDFTI